MTFMHSVKLPYLYKQAAKICKRVEKGEAGIKQLVYERKFGNLKALYALVSTTFAQAAAIDLLLKRTNLLEKEPRLDPWLARVLITELLWGAKKLPNEQAKPILTIRSYEQAFKSHLSDCQINDTKERSSVKIPRYVRINTLTTSLNEAQNFLEEEGWILQHLQSTDKEYSSFLEQVHNLEGDYFMKDFHIPNLLIFPPSTDFHRHPGYTKGTLVLQDKASCIPVHILSPPPGSIVLDMCAAPGMKTTQLATAINDEGTIYAVEKDPKRFETLNMFVTQSGATCVKTINKDVLDCSSEDFPDVEYILVDPSCSGSGLLDRIQVSQVKDPARLEKLAGFQIKMLRTALTRYPKAKKVVYSTCSLYPEENEDVVRQVLETNDNFKLIPAGNFLNDKWNNFGSPDFGDIGKYCLYAKTEDDLTVGFFMAVFERLKDGEYNHFYNGRIRRFTKKLDRQENRKNRLSNKNLVEESQQMDKQNAERTVNHLKANGDFPQELRNKIQNDVTLIEDDNRHEVNLKTNKSRKHQSKHISDIKEEKVSLDRKQTQKQNEKKDMEESNKIQFTNEINNKRDKKIKRNSLNGIEIDNTNLEIMPISKSEKKRLKRIKQLDEAEKILADVMHEDVNKDVQQSMEIDKCKYEEAEGSNKKPKKRKRKSCLAETELLLVEELLDKYKPAEIVHTFNKQKKKSKKN